MNIWSVSDINEGKHYCLYLCQSGEGKRYFQLADADSRVEPEEVFAKTKVIDNELLIKRSLMAISKNSVLVNGEKFYVDPHGMWITQSESDQLSNGVDFFAVKWDTDLVPDVARR